jgi:hypothetical protein
MQMNQAADHLISRLVFTDELVDECLGDLALIENRQGVNRPQSHVRDAGLRPLAEGPIRIGQ